MNRCSTQNCEYNLLDSMGHYRLVQILEHTWLHLSQPLEKDKCKKDAASYMYTSKLFEILQICSPSRHMHAEN